MIHYRIFTNQSFFSLISFSNLSNSQFFQTFFNHDPSILAEIFLITRPIFFASKCICLLQGLKFSTWCKVANNIILSIIQIFFDITAIYQSLLILIASEHLQYLNINQTVSSFFKKDISKNPNFVIMTKSNFLIWFHFYFNIFLNRSYCNKLFFDKNKVIFNNC